MLGRLKFKIEGLVTEMLDQLPCQMWQDPKVTFLDPAMGGGQFLEQIVERLRAAGHANSNIRRRVFGLEANEGRVNFVRLKNLPIQTAVGGVEVDYEEVFGLKKFDVIIGNPPFSDGSHTAKPIYIDFIKKSLVMATAHVLLVTPSTWAATGFKDTKSMIYSRGLKKFVFISDYFQNIKMALCWFWCDLSYDKKNVEITFSSKVKTAIDIEDSTNIIDYKDTALLEFLEKYGTSEKFKLKKTPTRKFSYHKEDKNGIDLLVTLGKNGYRTVKVSRTNVVDPDIKKYRIVFGEYRRGAIAIIGPGIAVPNTFYYLAYASKKDAIEMFNYFMSPEIRWVVAKTHTTRTFCGAALKCVPYRNVNDSKTFNLTASMKTSIADFGDLIPY